MIHADGYEDRWEKSLGISHEGYLNIIEYASKDLQKSIADLDKATAIDSIKDLEPLDDRVGKVFFLDPKYGSNKDPEFKPNAWMGVWLDLEAKAKEICAEWYDYVAVCVIVTWWDIKELFHAKRI